MASIAIMVGGAVLNATSFIGGIYLAHYLSGDDPSSALAEKERHDKLLEKYNEAVERFREGQERLRDFIAQNDRLKHEASENLVNVDNALKLYNQTHQGSQLPRRNRSSRTSTGPAHNKGPLRWCMLAVQRLLWGMPPVASSESRGLFSPAGFFRASQQTKAVKGQGGCGHTRMDATKLQKIY